MRLHVSLIAALCSLALVACHHPSQPRAVDNAVARDRAAAPPPLPCGAAIVDELDPYGKTSIGPCSVVEVRGDVELREDGHPIMRSGEAHPLVALDPRIPGPAGLRVGMTIAEVRRAAPAYRWIECDAFPEGFQCELRRVAQTPDCGDGDPDDAVYVELQRPAGLHDGDELSADDAWARLDDQPLTGVVLMMPC